MPPSPFIFAGDLSLHCIDELPVVPARDALEPLVFIHALGCDLHLWDEVARAFKPERRVIRYDLRGHGLSDLGPPECSIEDHAHDLDELLKELGVGPAVLIGASVGGVIALAMALRFPARVRRLVMCAAGARIGTSENWQARIESVRTLGLEGVADSLLTRWFASGFAEREPAVYRGYRNRLVRTRAFGYMATCHALQTADFSCEAAGVRVPLLVLSGEQDAVVPSVDGRDLAAGIPGARHEVIRGAAHLPPVEQPEATSAAIRRFLETPA